MTGIDWEHHRRELLDIGLRNSLVNYRPSTARGVEVMGESSFSIFEILVGKGKAMSFVAKPGEVAGQDIAGLELTEEEKRDSKLQTGETRGKLLKRLLNTYHAARLHIGERGFNNLFLALGFVKWFESEESEKERIAPLVLVPVTLSRTSVRQQYRLSYNGEDVETNLSLQNKMMADFGIELPSIPEAVEDLDVEDYLAECCNAVSGQEGWEVLPDCIHLGFFSFMKLMMYQDLDLDNWPDEYQPDNHPVFSALDAGSFPGAKEMYPDDQNTDVALKVAEANQVTDADSTQLLAILDTREGRNLVIQGPPGTGKSQTITNLVADAVDAGKKVLFVAEKMAALEVVKRRLDGLGLGNACLELHSHKANKKEVLQELSATLGLQGGKVEELGTGTLQSAIDDLNCYGDALNKPVGDSGISPYQAIGLRSRIQRGEVDLSGIPQEFAPDPKQLADMVLTTPESAFNALRADVRELQCQLGEMGLPSQHPFSGCGLMVCLPNDEARAGEVLAKAKDTCERLNKEFAGVVASRGLHPEETQEGFAQVVELLDLFSNSPDMDGVCLDMEKWRGALVDLPGQLAELEETQAKRKELEGLFYDQAWEADLLGEMQALRDKGNSFWKFLSGDYRNAEKRVKSLCRDGGKVPPSELVMRLEGIQKVKESEKRVSGQDGEMSDLFGSIWRSARSDVGRLQAVVSFLQSLIPFIDDGLIQDFEPQDSAGAKEVKEGLELAEKAFKETRESLFATLEMDAETRHWWECCPYQEVPGWLDSLLQNLTRIHEQVGLNHLSKKLGEAGLEWVVDVAKSWDKGMDCLEDWFCLQWYERLLSIAFNDRPELAGFTSKAYESKIRTFQNLDKALLQANRARIAKKHVVALPSNTNAGGQMGVLLKEMNKKSRHLPIRKLLSKAGLPIQEVKPVFMMSPMSVAAYLEQGGLGFDLVVFDEASQVKPVDAYGAFMRGKQVVVVGDSKQMPPTSFFDSDGGAGEFDEEEDSTAVPADLESILNLMVARGAPQRMLRWHYRSRHDSLIALSNNEFYNGRLHTFPSPYTGHLELGLKFHHLPETQYEPGKAVNPLEAEQVAKQVMAHAIHHPGQSLGVVTFSVKQRDAIMEEVEALRRESAEGEAFFQQHEAEEPFFVKNLETVQGDERDVIFISVGYGKKDDGKMSMSFGPVNQEGGERRLNVLFTRSRMRVETFANFTHSDIDLSRTEKLGPRVLKSFLRYAAEGFLAPGQTDPGVNKGEAFADAVAEALSKEGVDVAKDVGSGGYVLDLAIKDPEKPGKYLMGIECDGSAYQSAQSTRDRDRIRPAVLSNLGWKAYRVWSTDWFRNPVGEIQKIQGAIQAITEPQVETPEPKPATPPQKAPTKKKASPQPDEPPPSNAYVLAKLKIRLPKGKGFEDVPADKVRKWILDAVEQEGPVHQDEVFKRIREALDIPRATKKIKDHFAEALEACLQTWEVLSDEGFLTKPGREVILRDRSGAPSSLRKAPAIPPAEYQLAIKEVVADAFGIQGEEIPKLVVKKFGIKTASKPFIEEVEANLEYMAAEGDLLVKDGSFSIP